MNFTLVGQPYEGLYTIRIEVTSIISNGHISNNLASIYGYLLRDDNIKDIESKLNIALQVWFSTGLRYIAAWKERIDHLQ
jgi:hypothetical protein